ncbi:MAG: 2-oxoacid:acceptor oxidoreductase family protein [Candidatus Njordarchaeales archaeon]
MKRNFYEIRIHGRGGQGAWTASLILAQAAVIEGKYAQSFPEFGPERSGAPVTAYARIGEEPIHMHCGITEADYIIVIDPTLVDRAKSGIREGGKIIATYPKPPEVLRKELGVDENVEIWSVNAVKIALDIIGRPIANTAMLGAFVKATEEKIIKLNSLIEAVKKVLGARLPEEIVERNIQAIKKAYEEVKKA